MNNKFKEFWSYILIIVIVLIIRTFIVSPVRVDGNSMFTTLKNGEILLLKKYDKKIKRFDIVVFKNGSDKLIKRVIGLPGEHVAYKDNKLYINRELVEDVKLLTKTGDFELENLNVSVIPDNYYIELKEALGAIKEIQRELSNKPIDVDTLNVRVDTARDLVFKLHNTTSEMVKLSLLSEYAIVYGNRYRSSKQSINEGLIKAEKLFFEGKYKKSLEISISTLDVVEPGIHKKILDYNK